MNPNKKDIEEKYTAMSIANYIISYCNESSDKEINNLKLQKILYYIQGLYLVNYGLGIFKEDIQKWQYGPVVPEVYHSFKDYGSSKIKRTEPEIILNKTSTKFSFEVKEFDESNIEEKDKLFIRTITDTLLGFPAFKLVEATHQHKGWLKHQDRIIKGEKNLIYTREELIEDFRPEAIR